MVIGIPVWRNSNNNTLYFFKSKSNRGILLSCECLERLDLGLNSGWVSFRARFIKLFFLRFRRKMNPKKVLTGGGRSLTGAERARKFRVAHHYNCRPP